MQFRLTKKQEYDPFSQWKSVENHENKEKHKNIVVRNYGVMYTHLVRNTVLITKYIYRGFSKVRGNYVVSSHLKKFENSASMCTTIGYNLMRYALYFADIMVFTEHLK